jgi:phospholipase C
VVVIFQENVSFDHYFATYPNATNPAGEPFFAGGTIIPTSTMSLAPDRATGAPAKGLRSRRPCISVS